MIPRFRRHIWGSSDYPRSLRLAAAVLCGLLAAACSSSTSNDAGGVERPAVCEKQGAEPPRPEALVMGGGNPGGVYYPYANGLANLFDGRLNGTNVRTVVTGGSVENLKLLGDGEVDLAIATADAAAAAVAGRDGFARPLVICGLAVLYTSFVHVVARDDAGITMLSDLRGKRISFGPPGSSTELVAPRLLAGVGLTFSDFGALRMSAAESVDALAKGSIDAFFWLSGLPAAAFLDLFAGADVHFVETASAFASLDQRFPGTYRRFTLPADTYPHQTADVEGLGVTNILVARPGVPAETVRQLLNVMFLNTDALHAVHPAASKLDKLGAAEGMPIPRHRGATTFFG